MNWSLGEGLEVYSDKDLIKLNPLSIAYIGDCVYEFYFRNYLIKEFGAINSNKLHSEVIKHVNARSQKDAYFKIRDLLTEEEILYFKKGRNSKVKTIPKNFTIAEYKIATGLETLIGYLYIVKRFERLDKIFKYIMI